MNVNGRFLNGDGSRRSYKSVYLARMLGGLTLMLDQNPEFSRISVNSIISQFLAQGTATDSQQGCRLALIAARMGHGALE